jgi:hypothetical protein
VFVEAVGIRAKNVKKDETFVVYRLEGNLWGSLFLMLTNIIFPLSFYLCNVMKI